MIAGTALEYGDKMLAYLEETEQQNQKVYPVCSSQFFCL